MPYSVPTFNLSCLIYHIAGPPYDFAAKEFVEESVCQLRGYGRFPRPPFSTPIAAPTGDNCFSLLLPAGTAIGDSWCVGAELWCVEVPLGTGRWYLVLNVDDVAKGFPNEYRIAGLAKGTFLADIDNWPRWPFPIP